MSNEIKITITKQDKALLDNLIRILGRAKVELEGVEILAASDSMRWLSRLQRQTVEEFNKPPVQVISTDPIKKPIKKQPKSKGE